jgi:hypothetical protein
MSDPGGALRMFKRRLVYVEDWFDDQYEVPWNWVQRSGDGRFEAIACHLVDDAMVETLVGVFDNATAAAKALHAYIRTETALMRLNYGDHENE